MTETAGEPAAQPGAEQRVYVKRGGATIWLDTVNNPNQLTDMQLRMVDLYLRDPEKNQTRAYVAAGNPDGPNARKLAHKHFTKPHVQAEITRRLNAMSEEERRVVMGKPPVAEMQALPATLKPDPAKIAAALNQIIQADVSQLFETDQHTQKLKQKRLTSIPKDLSQAIRKITIKDGAVTIELYDKLKAIELAAKISEPLDPARGRKAEGADFASEFDEAEEQGQDKVPAPKQEPAAMTHEQRVMERLSKMKVVNGHAVPVAN